MRYRRAIFYNGLLAVVYAAMAFASLRLFATLNASASPVWPPTGLAIAALLIWSPRLWPGIYAGAFAANLLNTGNPVTSATIAVGNTLEAVIVTLVVLRFAGGARAFDHPRSLGIFVLAGIAAPMVSASVGVTSLAVAGLAQWSSYGSVWITWWLGDASGALVVAPLIVSFVRRPTPPHLGRVGELVLLVAAVFVTGALVFAQAIFSVVPAIPLSFAVVPIIIWAGLRYGARGATGTTFLFSTIAVVGTLEKLGPYGSSNINTGLLSLQFSIMVIATVGLELGAVVHERLDAQEEARKALAAEKRFETLVDSAPDAMVIADVDGRIVQVNSQAEKVFGYSRVELLSLKVEDLEPPRLRSLYEKDRREFLAAPRTRGMGVGLEFFGLRKDGTEFPVEISLSPLHTEGGLRILKSIRDISERRRAQEESARLSAIVESSTDAVIRETLEGEIVGWNRGAERLFGYSSLEAVGQSAGILSPMGDHRESELLDKLKRDGRVVPYETQLTRKDGAIIDVSLSVSPIRDPIGRTVGASVVIQDLTARKTKTTKNKPTG